MILDRSVSKNFFGREVLLEVLYRTISAARDGGAGSMLLSGKRGVGKTRLLANLYDITLQQKDVLPFFYTARTAFASAEDFANDYLGSFILQSLVFLGKDPADLSGIYSLEELKVVARDLGARWIADIVNNYIEVRKNGEEAKIVYHALSAPYSSYQITGVPVVVIIDDLHKIRKFCEPKGNDINSGFWTLFEDSISSMHVPHIFSGVPHEIEKLYFEEALMVDQVEIIDLPGLDEEHSLKLFKAASEMYGLKLELEPSDVIGRFAGNPLYIKNFMQAARHAGGTLSKDVFEQVYDNEITVGKTYRYWIYLLKKYVKPLELRKPSLAFLSTLLGDRNSDGSSTDLMSLDQDVLERIAGLLHDSGSIETGFSETLPADEVLKDILKGLCIKEGQNGSTDKVRELIAGNEDPVTESPLKESGTASFVITVPADPRAGLVAIKSFEQVAVNYKIPLKVMSKLQLAMADLFTNVLSGDASVENFRLQVRLVDNFCLVEITTPQKGLELNELDSSRIGAYLDELKVGNIEGGTVITLTKEIK